MYSFPGRLLSRENQNGGSVTSSSDVTAGQPEVDPIDYIVNSFDFITNPEDELPQLNIEDVCKILEQILQDDITRTNGSTTPPQ